MGALIVGKLPGAGDFVARGLAPAERRWWDEALCAGVAAAEARAGDDFAALWEAALPWRFAIMTPGGRASGAICASADAAGRRFPLVVARRGHGWAAACEAALFAAFAAGQAADVLHAALLALPAGGGASDAAGWWLDGGESAGVARIAGNDPAAVLPAMLLAATVTA